MAFILFFQLMFLPEFILQSKNYFIYSIMKQNLYDDMCQMSDLTQESILKNLVQRYRQEDIFTYIGATLIAINPYRNIEKLFNPEIIEEISKKVLEGKTKGAPHVYMIAGKAFQSMMNGQKKQAIIISGESGAGKTESTKYCMQLLTNLSRKQSNNQSIQAKILSCNPILQAFGNSKTIKNENSSRFGKYVQIYFGLDQSIKGANIQNYLLQKSRVVSVNENQRNFHIFYALTASKLYQVKEASYYNYLNQSKCYQANNRNDYSSFLEIKKSFYDLGFTAEEQERIWRLLKTILLFGNIKLDDKNHIINVNNPCTIINKEILQQISETLKVNLDHLEEIIVNNHLKVGKQIIKKRHDKLNCMVNINTFSKALYNAIFEYIIYKIEIALKPKNKQYHKFKSIKMNLDQEYSEINILDIFGFQDFQENSLEQICINYTNEKLLSQYNQTIFQNQMQTLRQDGLQNQLQGINPPTNQHLINVIDQIFKTINEKTIPKQYDQNNMIETMKVKYPKSHLIMFNRNLFTIVHSPCKISYNIQGFKIKNQDKISNEIEDIILNQLNNKNKAQQGKTLLQKFIMQINQLITELSSATNHYIRCIKPNDKKLENNVNQSYLKNQIKYLGVFETIKIRQVTFPYRKTYEQFADLYGQMYNQCKGKIPREVVNKILKKLNVQSSTYLCGNIRIYLNKDVEKKLDSQMQKFIHYKNVMIVKIQRKFRSYLNWKQKMQIFRQKLHFLKRFKDKWEKCDRKLTNKQNQNVFQFQLKAFQNIKYVSAQNPQNYSIPSTKIQQQRPKFDQIQKEKPNLIQIKNQEQERQVQQSKVQRKPTNLIYENINQSYQLLQEDFKTQQDIFNKEKQEYECKIQQCKNQNKQIKESYQIVQQDLAQKQKIIYGNIIKIEKLELNLQRQQEQSLIKKKQQDQLKQIIQKHNFNAKLHEEQMAKIKYQLKIKDDIIKQLSQSNNKKQQQILTTLNSIKSFQNKYKQFQEKQKFKIKEKQQNLRQKIQYTKYLEDMVKDYEKIITQYKKEKNIIQEQKLQLRKKVLNKIKQVQILKEGPKSVKKINIPNYKDGQIKKLKQKLKKMEEQKIQQYQLLQKKTEENYNIELKLFNIEEKLRTSRKFINLNGQQLAQKQMEMNNELNKVKQTNRNLQIKINSLKAKNVNLINLMNQNAGKHSQMIKRNKENEERLQKLLNIYRKKIQIYQEQRRSNSQLLGPKIKEENLLKMIKFYKLNNSKNKNSLKTKILDILQ